MAAWLVNFGHHALQDEEEDIEEEFDSLNELKQDMQKSSVAAQSESATAQSAAPAQAQASSISDRKLSRDDLLMILEDMYTGLHKVQVWGIALAIC